MKRSGHRIIYSLTALFLCIFFSFAAVSCGEEQQTPVSHITAVPKNSEDTSEEDADAPHGDDLYRIENLDTAGEHITLRDLETQRLYRFHWGLLTHFIDKYGSNALVTDFTPGRVVTIGPLDRNRALSSVKLSDKTFEIDDLTNYSIDYGRNVFSIGSMNYKLTGDTKVFEDEIVGDIAGITDNDTLRVIGIDKEIISIVVTTGHGYLYITNTALFADSLMQIGQKIFVMVRPEDMTVEVPEGQYFLTVANKGYGGTTEVAVPRGNTVHVNLDDLRGEGPKSCVITFHIGVDGAHIYLDGNEVPAESQLTVQYGVHKLKVTADGYDEWTRTLYVNSPSAEISLDLSDEKKDNDSPQEEKTDENENQESSTQDDSGGNNPSGNNAENAQQTAQEIINNATNSNADTSNPNDQDGDGDYDEDDAEIDYLSTLSNMISTFAGTE